MGNRMIRDSLLESNKIAGLSDFDFRLWITLILLADDYGVVDARPLIIKGFGYPLRDVAVNDISEALTRLAVAGCVVLYTVGGKPFAQFPKWSAHQRLRNSKHKYPTSDKADQTDIRGDSRQVAASCGEFENVAADGGGLPLELEVEVEKELELEREVEVEHTQTQDNNPPTLDEVKAYASEKGYKNFNSDWFVTYYSKRDWTVFGKRIDWRDKVDSWVAHELDKEARRVSTNPALQYAQRDNSTYENFEFFDLDKWMEGKK